MVDDATKEPENQAQVREATEDEKAERKLVDLHAVDLKLVAARAAHEVNRAYCQSLGDDSQVPWSEAAQWQKESAYMGACAIVENPGITTQQQHTLWVAHKVREGWTFGEEESEEKKTHPCLVSYDDLPPEQRLKDTLFGAAVRGVLG